MKKNIVKSVVASGFVFSDAANILWKEGEETLVPVLRNTIASL